jgi:lipoprotein NlpD
LYRWYETPKTPDAMDNAAKELTERRHLLSANGSMDAVTRLMNKRRYILWAMAVVLSLPACSSIVEYQAPTTASERDMYMIREGESLYAIAWHYGLDYKQVARWNNIQAPYTIYPGQRIRLNPPPTVARTEEPETLPVASAPVPATWFPPPTASPSAAHTARTTSVPAQPAFSLRPLSPESISPPMPAASQASVQGWQWPVQGEMIRGFSPNGNGKKGIDIAGRPGQPIQAASSGKVVYSGGGLVGYGELIIIKHDHNFLSAYAHNRKLLVKEGEQVRAGQMIAELGSTGAERPMLHFQIRRDGDPVDPLQYLPGR